MVRNAALGLIMTPSPASTQVISLLPGYTTSHMTDTASEAGAIGPRGQHGKFDPRTLVQPDDVARALLFAVDSPQNVCLSEIVIRGQQHHTFA
eukprot:tig00000403_g275.t1